MSTINQGLGFFAVAERKLAGLIVEDGFSVNGVAIRNDQTGQQGFVTDAGLVGWWQPESDAQTVKAQRDELLEALLTSVDHIDMTALEISHCKDAARIRAAIAKVEGGAA